MQVLHHDGVLRLVQQRGLVADMGIGLFAGLFRRGPGGKDLQRGGDKIGLRKLLAKQHKDHAGRFAPHCRTTAARQAWLCNRPTMGDKWGTFARSWLTTAGVAGEGPRWACSISYRCSAPGRRVDDQPGFPDACGSPPRVATGPRQPTWAPRASDMLRQLHKNRYRWRRIPPPPSSAPRSQLLLFLAGARRLHDAKGQVIGKVLQQSTFLRPDAALRGIEIEQSEGALGRAQRQADDTVETQAPACAWPDRREGSACNIAHDDRLAGAHRGSSGPRPQRIVRPGTAPASADSRHVVTGVGHDFNGFLRIAARKADPAEFVAANVHHDVGRTACSSAISEVAHQGFVAAAEHVAARAMRASSGRARRRSVTLVAITWRAAMLLNVMPREDTSMSITSPFFLCGGGRAHCCAASSVTWPALRRTGAGVLRQPQVLHAHAQNRSSV